MRNNFLVFLVIFFMFGNIANENIVFADNTNISQVSQMRIDNVNSLIEALPNIDNFQTEDLYALSNVNSYFHQLSEKEKNLMKKENIEKLEVLMWNRQNFLKKWWDEFLEILNTLPEKELLTLEHEDVLILAIRKMDIMYRHDDFSQLQVREAEIMRAKKYLQHMARLRVEELELTLPELEILTISNFHIAEKYVQDAQAKLYQKYPRGVGVFESVDYIVSAFWREHFAKIEQLREQRREEDRRQQEEERKNQEEERRKREEESRRVYAENISKFVEMVKNFTSVENFTLNDRKKFMDLKSLCLKVWQYSEGSENLVKICDYNKSSVPLEIVEKFTKLEEKYNILTDEITRLSSEIENFPEHNIVVSDETAILKLKKMYDELVNHQKQNFPEKQKRKLDFLLNELNKVKNGNSGNSRISSGSSSSSSSFFVYSPMVTANPQTNPVSKNEKNSSNAKIFPNFKQKTTFSNLSLTDEKLIPLQKEFNATTEKTRNEPLTRGEFLKIVLDASKIDISQISQDKNFSDIKNSDVIAKYTKFALDKNIISGYSDGTFRPNNNISRAEATKILVNTLPVNLAENQTQFADISKDNTLGKYIQTAYNYYLVNGTSTTTFEPNHTISRGELIKILYNIMN